MDDHGEKLRSYLLGSLPASETEELDMLIISGDDLSEALTHAEQDLIEEHLDRALSPEDEELFEKNFLTSPERRQMVRETSLLRAFADDFNSPTATVSENAVSLVDKLRAILARPAFAGAAVVATVLVAALVWQVFLRDSSTPLEREYAAMNRKDLSNTAELANLSSISLASANLRAADPSAKNRVSDLTDTILVRLALPAGDETNAFIATISRSTTKVFTLKDVKSYQNPNGREVRMLLPKKVLEKGQYQIRLERPSGDSTLTYVLTLE